MKELMEKAKATRNKIMFRQAESNLNKCNLDGYIAIFKKGDAANLIVHQMSLDELIASRRMFDQAIKEGVAGKIDSTVEDDGLSALEKVDKLKILLGDLEEMIKD